MNNNHFKDGEEPLVTVLNVDGRKLTPCLPHRAWREVERSRAVWIDEQTIKLLYNPFLFRDYRKAALKRDGKVRTKRSRGLGDRKNVVGAGMQQE